MLTIDNNGSRSVPNITTADSNDRTLAVLASTTPMKTPEPSDHEDEPVDYQEDDLSSEIQESLSSCENAKRMLSSLPSLPGLVSLNDLTDLTAMSIKNDSMASMKTLKKTKKRKKSKSVDDNQGNSNADMAGVTDITDITDRSKPKPARKYNTKKRKIDQESMEITIISVAEHDRTISVDVALPSKSVPAPALSVTDGTEGSDHYVAMNVEKDLDSDDGHTAKRAKTTTTTTKAPKPPKSSKSNKPPRIPKPKKTKMPKPQKTPKTPKLTQPTRQAKAEDMTGKTATSAMNGNGDTKKRKKETSQKPPKPAKMPKVIKPKKKKKYQIKEEEQQAKELAIRKEKESMFSIEYIELKIARLDALIHLKLSKLPKLIKREHIHRRNEVLRRIQLLKDERAVWEKKQIIRLYEKANTIQPLPLPLPIPTPLPLSSLSPSNTLNIGNGSEQDRPNVVKMEMDSAEANTEESRYVAMEIDKIESPSMMPPNTINTSSVGPFHRTDTTQYKKEKDEFIDGLTQAQREKLRSYSNAPLQEWQQWEARLKKYLQLMEGNPEFIDQDVCPNPACHSAKLILREDEGQVVCPKCARTNTYLVATNSSLPFGEDIDVDIHVYYREKHFRLWLNQFRASGPEVPDEVIRVVRDELDTTHLQSTLKVRATGVRKILRARGLGEWTDYSVRIAYRFNRCPIPSFTDEQIKVLIGMYKQVQIPFLFLKMPNRKNFLNSSYLMRQFCTILKWDKYRQCFPFPKSDKVCERQDLMWRRICLFIGWVFNRSM